jgi:hypothetical protein
VAGCTVPFLHCRCLGYREDGTTFFDPRWDGRTDRVAGFRDEAGAASLPLGPIDLAAHPAAHPDGALWPRELQDPSASTRKGRISNRDFDPEYLEGDFFDLKNVHLGEGDVDDDRPSDALQVLDRVRRPRRVPRGHLKHMDLGASRFFAPVIHEFAQTIGKRTSISSPRSAGAWWRSTQREGRAPDRYSGGLRRLRLNGCSVVSLPVMNAALRTRGRPPKPTTPEDRL